MKMTRLFFGILFCLVAVSLALNIGSCTHEDDIIDIIDPGEVPAQYGDDIVDTDDGWSLDVAHSSVRWETKYRGTSALLSGRFNDFSVNVSFVEDKPEQISIVGTVNLFSVNTGQPARDTGCLVNTMGMNENPDAIFTSTHVDFDNKGGYIVMGILDFHGITSEVTMTLEYTGTTHVDASNPYDIAGLKGQFEMSAITIFGVESTSIDNRVIVKLDMNLRKPT